MTDVTLRVGTGYQVVFLDTTETQVLAQSAAFEVKAPGSQYPQLGLLYLISNLTFLHCSIARSYRQSFFNHSTRHWQRQRHIWNGTVSGSAASSTSTSKKSNAALGLAFDASGLFSVCGIIAFGASFL